MKDLTNGALDEQLQYAESIGNITLSDCIKRLKGVEENCGYETTITKDFAPRSFCFSRKSKKTGEFAGNGGIIFHDVSNGVGTAGGPSFSVSLDDDVKPRWSIHT